MSDYIKLPPFRKEEDTIIEFNQLSPVKGWHIEKLNVDGVHRLSRGAGVKVGVIDTGLDVNTLEVQKSLKRYVDVTGEGTHCPPHVVHGTHVSTTIVGWKNVYGVAPDVDLYHIKALKNSGGGSSSDVARAIDILREEKVHIINMSLGSDSLSRPIKNAIDRADKEGIVIVCAAGNDGLHIDYPAALINTIGVAAVGHLHGKWFLPDFTSPSTGNKEVNVAAPGVMIKAAGPTKDGQERIVTLSGTSMASPFFTGVLALDFAYKEFLSLQEIDKKIEKSTINPEGFDVLKVGEGIISPDKFLNYTAGKVRSCEKVHPALKGVNSFLWKFAG